MPITSLFRTILIAGLVFAISSVVAGLSLTETLPPSLQDYLMQVEGEEISSGRAIFFLLIVLSIFIILPIITVGIWKFKPWARTLYVVISVVFIPFYPIMGPVVMNGWQAMLYDLSLMLEGILIAMMFTGEINERFKKSNASVAS